MFSYHMNPVRITALCLIGLTAAAVGQEKPADPTGGVEVTVRDPKGRPLEHAAIEVLPFDRDHFPDKRAGVSVTSDDLGKVRFAWPVGVDHVRLLAKGIGYGVTGTFEVVEGKTAHPSAPPLVAYGAIVGFVPKALLQPGTYVLRRDVDTDKEYRAACDEKGRFAMEDVPCGLHRLEVRVDDKPLGVRAIVRVEPGQRIRASIYKNQDPPYAIAHPDAPGPPPKKEEQAVWAGVVRDEKGRAVEGASVYAMVLIDDTGDHPYTTIQSAKSDDKGRWEIKVKGDPSLFSGSLLAHKPGRLPAVLPLPVPGWEPRASDEEDKRNCELILPDQGGGLDVTALSGDKPLANATVQLDDDAQLYYSAMDHIAGSESEWNQVENILYPTATTNDSGVARFRDLPPGAYTVYISSGDAMAVKGIRQERWSDRTGAYSICHGVPVRKGEMRKYQAVVYPQPNSVRCRVRQTDGKPLTEREPKFSGASVAGDYGQSYNTQLDENGVGSIFFESPGLWQISFRYRDSPVRWSLSDTPYFEAAGVLAVSPLLENRPPTPLTAQLHQPGALIVQLEDANGRPASGAVLIDGHFREPTFAGSTDRNGALRFEGVQARKHDVEAHFTRLNLPDLGIDDAPFPQDKELVGRTAVFRQEVATVDDDETRVTIRPKRVGYIRGVVHPPKGRSTADYKVQYWVSDGAVDFWDRYDIKTGEFAFGPLPEGKVTVYISKGDYDAGSKEVEVRSDRVAHIEFTPPAEVKPPRALDRKIRGQVLLSDGKTPAGAARLEVIPVGMWPPGDRGETDARGRIHMRESRWPPNDKPNDRPGSPQGPVIVAWLPGACGATITPLADDAQPPLKIVLPPPLRIQGKVTVGGKVLDGRKNQFRVLASYEGKGKLDELLSVDVSAEADGRFELASLTPGTYQIQAAMDGIWLSRAVRLIIKADAAPTEALTLDIGEPGAPSVLELVHRDGTPARGGTAKVVRPKGPLTDLLWPTEFTADGAGVIQIPPLEVGSHKVRVKGAAEEQTLVIPSLLDAQAKPVKVRVVVE